MIKGLLPILALMMATQTHAQTWQDTVNTARAVDGRAFSALDMELRDEMRRFVFAHIRARNIPAVLITHDPRMQRPRTAPAVIYSEIRSRLALP